MWLNGPTQWEDHKIGKQHRKREKNNILAPQKDLLADSKLGSSKEIKTGSEQSALPKKKVNNKVSDLAIGGGSIEGGALKSPPPKMAEFYSGFVAGMPEGDAGNGGSSSDACTAAPIFSGNRDPFVTTDSALEAPSGICT